MTVARRRRWSEKEIAQIRRMAAEFPAQQIAKKLARSEAAIRVQAWKFGLSLRSKADVAARPPKPAPVAKQPVANPTRPVELVVAPGAIERALGVYEQLQPHDPSVISQARKILTEHIFGMIGQGEQDAQRLIVGGLAHLKALERDHATKSRNVQNRRKQDVTRA
jgi:hypothetical protein